MSEPTKVKKSRRELVKDIAIIFLALMLVLTLFSNTFMNYSLPEVSTQYVSSGQITTRVRGSGTVTTSDPYVIEAQANQIGRKIASVPVKVGDTVEKGDLLLILEEGDGQELKDAQAALEAAEETLKQMTESYESGIISGGIPADAVYAVENGSAGTFSANLAMLAQKENEIDAAEAQIDAYERQIEALNAQLRQLDKDMPNQYGDGQAAEQIAKYQGELEAARNYLGGADQVISAAQAALDAAEKALSQAPDDEGLIAARDAAQADLDSARQQKADAEKQVGSLPAQIGYWEAYAQKDTVKAEIRAVEADISAEQDKISGLNGECSKLRQDFGYVQSLQKQLDDIAKQREEVEKQRQAVEKLQESGAGQEIEAPVSGTITSLTYRAGETINNTDLGSIQIDGKEATMTVSVTPEQARLLQVGEYAEIQNSWYYSNISARISAIRVDPSDPQNGRLVVLTVEGDVMNGQNLSVLMGQRSADYNLTVPNSAIREDNNGKFILIVEYKSSPLGTRYVASRVDVEVLASDDSRTAISGMLNGYEYVITTASKPVEPGQLIRLADN